MPRIWGEAVSLYQMTSECCGIVFAIADDWHERKLRQEGGTWWCPGCGHKWRYGNNSQVAVLKRKLEYEEARAVRERDRADKNERRLNATKGHLTRTKKRIAAGVCPCCRRNFQNVAQHMQHMHPDYSKTAEREAT